MNIISRLRNNIDEKSISTNSSVDLLKFIFSFMLLGFHLVPTFGFSDLEFYYSEWLCRICVPFFFISTGYYLAKAPITRINKYLVKISEYYIIASVIYLPFSLALYENIAEYFHAFFVDGTHFHLWYFPALILGVILSYSISKLNNKNQYFIVFLFLGFGIFFNEHYKLLLPYCGKLETYHYILSLFGTTRNGLFFAFPLISIGRLINKDDNLKKNIFLFVLFSILYFIEVTTLKPLIPYVYLDLSIFGFFVPYYLFKICLIKNIKINKKISLLLRKSSTIVYIIHPFTISVINYVGIVNPIARFAMCSLMCLLGCALCLRFVYFLVKAKGKYK